MKTTLQLEGLPASPHMETAILGAAMLYPESIAEALTLEPSDFLLDSNQRIFRAILSLHTDGSHVDSSTVRERLVQRSELDAAGGYPYILHLEDGIPRNFNIEAYVKIVKDKARMRKVLELHTDAAELAYVPDQDSQAFIERSIADLRELADDHRDNDILSVGEYLTAQGEPETMFERMATVDGIPFGFGQLDELVGGAQRGELVIVAARPSMGKTAWACNTSRSTASRGFVTPLFALEQKKQAMVRRMLASAAMVEYKAIRENTVKSEDRRTLLEHRAILSRLPLYIDDTPKLTVSRIRSKCLRLKRRVGLDIVFIDQLSKVSSADVYQKGMQLREVVGKQTTALKLMAQELDVPVIVFNQLSREVGKRTDPKPRLEDLKESGNIEEDADLVILLHRPDYYDKTDLTLRGKAQMIVAKNREGSTDTLDCLYEGRILRWQDDYVPAAEQSGFEGRW